MKKKADFKWSDFHSLLWFTSVTKKINNKVPKCAHTKTQVTCLFWWVAHVLLVLVFSCSSAFVVGSQHTHAYCIKKLFPIISVILVAQKRYLQKWSYSAAIKCIFHKLTLSTFLEISTMYGWQKWLKELISLSLLIILVSSLKSSIVRAQHNIYFVFTENVNKAGSFEVRSECHINDRVTI